MSDLAILKAAELLEKLRAEREKVLVHYRGNGGSGDYSEAAGSPDHLDQAQAITKLYLRVAENAADRNRLELVEEAMARIGVDASQFDACQAGDGCLGDGRIEHERLDILPWAKLCCACAAASERGGGSR